MFNVEYRRMVSHLCRTAIGPCHGVTCHCAQVRLRYDPNIETCTIDRRPGQRVQH
ncbi:predicted protein [Plenodomus lingam JN3]|uniref:Predicted protein n=2 Tax=Leptosphaeria maculans TaxID=5022 RepID=E4ZPU0_LEPMJ|nr:predicted protein [Plenodomus lingam JN3]CBX93475.1 predicted protein [Plenodomus lingam JN3]